MSAPNLLQALRQRTGIDLGAASIASAVRQRARARGVSDARAYENEALRDETELRALIDLVVVPESWFFRDEDAFAAAADFARGRVATGRRVRVLCVPCARGEEPYSLAIALREAGIDAGAAEIDALDVSPDAVARARRAVYPRNAFRSRDLSFRDRHFEPAEDGWRLHDDIRRAVQFACGNLLSLIPPEKRLRYDIVFCRNLLIYFDGATQALAAARLRALLRDDGMLFAGHAETVPLCGHGFEPQPMARAFALRKTQGRTHAAPPATRIAADSPPANSGDEAAADGPADLLARAEALADGGEVRAAKSLCRRCLALAPDDAGAWFLLGLLNGRQEDVTEAAHCLRRAVYLDPDHHEALVRLALLAERQGDQAQARRFRERAARVHERLAAKGARR